MCTVTNTSIPVLERCRKVGGNYNKYLSYLLILDVNLDSFVQEILLEGLDALTAHLLIGGELDQGDVVQLGIATGGVETCWQGAKLGLRHSGAVAVVNVQDLDKES